MPLEIESKILQDALDAAQTGELRQTLLKQDLDQIKRIVSRVQAGQNIAALTVLITLFVKKIMSPEQDVRLHREGMTGGFSGRSLDTKYVTPFLLKNNFPYMQSGSGWLTRSFEHPHPYDLSYPGKITPAPIKEDFLKSIDRVQQNPELSEKYLQEIFKQLVSLREESQNLSLSRPKNKSINFVVSLIEKFWGMESSGLSRVPVIAVFAAYKCLINEVNRYKDCELLPLLAHNAPDQKTGRSGDIDIQSDSKTVEAVEIKHGISIDKSVVSSAIDKVKRTTLKRYYILSTKDLLAEMDEITKLTMDAKINHGCEVIVNGVTATLKYYLRLVSNTDDFMDYFVSELEKDKDISYKAKIAWDAIVEEEN